MDSLKTDCRQFRSDRPCAPHKLHGVVCATCREDYDPVLAHLLLVKLAAMGDVLRTTSLLPAIHRRWPQAHLTWLTRPASVPLLQRNPLVDRVISFQGSLPLELATERFDVILNPDAAADACALAHAGRSPSRVGFDFDERGAALPLTPGARHWMAMGVRDDLKKANRHTYQELMADVLELDYRREPPVLELDEAHRARGRQLRQQHAPRGGMIVGMNTGAGTRWRYKRWTESGFAELIERLGQEGHRVFLLGGPDDRERNARLAAASRGVAIDTGGDNTITDFAGIVEACDVVVTGDTLAMHVALARSRPVVALFGPTSLAEIDVFDRGERLAPDLECLVCYKSDCDFVPNCMESISPARVHAAILRCAGHPVS